MNSLSFNSIPGLNEAIDKAKELQFKTREDSLLGLEQNLLGFRVRTMTILDYVLLDRHQSPFVNRIEPAMSDLALFLWVLSPAYSKWRAGIGWRKLVPFLQPVAAYLYSRKVGKAFGKNIPESSEPIVLKCFDYINKMFFDSPPGMAKGGESCLCYLTGWFDSMQSEYHCSDEKVWSMGLPELFQRLTAIRRRNNPSVPTFNKGEDSIKLFVLRGLRSKEFTMEDLASGRFKLPDDFNLN